MKKNICPICGVEVFVSNEETTICENCFTKLDNELILKTDKLKLDKFNVNLYALNCQYHKILETVNESCNDLFLQYYKIFALLSLKKEYDYNLLLNNDYNYNNQDLEKIILHMIEFIKLYSFDFITKFIDKYNYKVDYFKKILSLTKKSDQKLVEKDLREKLFNTTVILESKKMSKNKEEGKSILLLGIILFIIFTIIVYISSDKELKYSMLNISAIIPCFVISKGLNLLITKKKNIIITIILFALIFYFLTLLITIPYNPQESNIFVDHLKGIGLSPYDLLKTIMERMNQNAL